MGHDLKTQMEVQHNDYDAIINNKIKNDTVCYVTMQIH